MHAMLLAALLCDRMSPSLTSPTATRTLSLLDPGLGESSPGGRDPGAPFPIAPRDTRWSRTAFPTQEAWFDRGETGSEKEGGADRPGTRTGLDEAMPPRKRKENASEVDEAEKKAKTEDKGQDVDERGCVVRDATPRAGPVPEGRRAWNGLFWNVNGMRALMRDKKGDLMKHVQDCDPDLLCLIEHKLQEKDVDDMLQQMTKELPGYSGCFTCSQDKKGYSGVAVFVKGKLPSPSSGTGGKKATTSKKIQSFFQQSQQKEEKKDDSLARGMHKVLSIRCGMNKPVDKEGRMITVEYDGFYVVTVYVPNSGDGLKRLDYRIHEWDKDFREYLTELRKAKPVVVGGDFNVAHLDRDIWNVEAKHIPKSAGTTPQERQSFSELLEAGFVDTFRHRHPEAFGCFTYWSVRANNRPRNRGLRLDYWLASSSLYSSDSPIQVHDSWHCDRDNGYGDHCPLAITLSLPSDS